ncbi:hypothetical protein [Streptomyces glomeratus]|uniref:hypothetical protein n=1 Tax=Streptomyces glomeratus TaxID=284452 RepID=UPI001F3002C1|nr:hypothetical protein [Streptomyces glomeratus]MCF1509891.1 hypothetical protein [Streptomyces glomeratus]
MTGVRPHHRPAPAAATIVTTSQTRARAVDPGTSSAASAPMATANTPVVREKSASGAAADRAVRGV